MEKFEELMMKIAKIFGIVMMCIILLVVIGLSVGLLVDFGSAIFKKSVPSVVFYKADYIEPGQAKDVEDSNKRPESEQVMLVRETVESIKAVYLKNMDSYLAEKAKDIFGDSDNIDDAKKSFRERKAREFTEANTEVLNRTIYYYPDKFKNAYLHGLVKYIKEADDKGISIFVSAENGLVSNLYYTKVYTIFTREFNEQKSEITAGDEKSDGWQNVLKSGITYLALFLSVTTFLIVAVMFAILRIEKKM